MRRHPLLQVVALTVAGTAVGSFVVLTVPWLPDEASSQAGAVDALYKALAVASVFIFSAVMSILVVSVVRFRRRSGHEGEGEPIHGHSGLEVLWTAIPAIIVTGAAIYSGVVLAEIEKGKPATRTIGVTAQQFAWTFDYEGLGVSRAGELHLVEGKNYVLRIRSIDVIHSFWVPEFRLKKDAVPGMTTEMRVTPSRTGSYAGVCAELCGLGHATMRARVVVEDQGSFDRWVTEQRKAASASARSS